MKKRDWLENNLNLLFYYFSYIMIIQTRVFSTHLNLTEMWGDFFI